MPDIPRLYTAIAEWSACLVFVILLRKRGSCKKTVFMSLIALVIQGIFLEVTGDVELLFWVPCMIAAFFLMAGYIYGCCRISYREAVYFGIQAFVAAEFVASLEWQISYYWQNECSPLWMQILLLLAIYGGVNGVIAGIVKSHLPQERHLEVGNRSVATAVVIGVAVFAVSNLSFVTQKTPFSGTYAFEIANIRTLVDFAGVAMLYAHLVQCCETKVRQELESVQNVLQNQYQQYKQSRESIDLINYKYHDLKHQIGILRQESDPEKRNAFLNKMEEEIRQYELQNKTGNSVLDTVLTGKSMYCDKHGITLTSVADGSLLDFMDTMDICSIFGNALDNAIECELKIPDKEKRLIHVTVTQQKNFLMIRFENYFPGELSMKEGKIATTKKEKRFHGYGIKSIRYTANKYEGAVYISVKDNWFELQILIPMQM